MRPATALHIPQPCHESWAAMSPTATGRHCAACAKTVVDFTLKTDAEILAYFASPGQATCGRFWADQLVRPLRAVSPPAAASRWRAWFAATVMVWSAREVSGGVAAAHAPAPAHHRPKRGERAGPGRRGPAPLIRGVVRDAATRAPVPGVAVFLKSENRQSITDSAGRFSLRVPAGQPQRHHSLVLHSSGYESQIVAVPASEQASRRIVVGLQANGAAAGVEVVGHELRQCRQQIGGSVSAIVAAELPDPGKPVSHPRRFYDWLSRLIRRGEPRNL